MDAFSEKLLVIFHNVNEWLKFAEAKNAVLLAFSGTAMAATLTALTTGQGMPTAFRWGLSLATGLLCIAALLSSISFLPKTALEKILWQKGRPSGRIMPQTTDNFYYFGDLRKYKIVELLDSLNTQYFSQSIQKPYSKEHEDLASQITVNSEIAFLKYRFFTYALYCLISSILAIPSLALLNLFLFRGL
jgi:Family of unknown function (DUF5706)